MAIRASASTPGRSDDRALAWMLGTLVVVWFVVIVAAGRRGVFVAGPTRPPLPLLVAFLGPPVVFAIAYRLVPRLRAFVLAIDLRLLTAMQAWRVIGGVFLVLYAFGLLPGLFAWPAGIGDLAVGMSAVFVLATGEPQADLGALPLSLIPTFAVPVWIIVPMLSMLRLRRGVGASAAGTTAGGAWETRRRP